jgi:hypothetical protein
MQSIRATDCIMKCLWADEQFRLVRTHMQPKLIRKNEATNEKSSDC